MNDPERVGPQEMSQGMTLKELIQRLLRQWILIGGVWGGVLVLVAAWTFLASPRYQSTATLRIMDDPRGMSLAGQLGDLPGASSLPGAGLLGFGREDLETEIGVLKSWRIAEGVVDSLSLAVQVTKPAGIRREVLEVLANGNPGVEAILTLRHEGQGSYSVRVKEDEEPVRDLGNVQAGGELEFGGYRMRLVESWDEGPPGKIRIEILPRYEAVKELREDLRVRRQEAASRLVDVAYTIPDRELAAAVVNGIVDEYVAYKSWVEGSEARHTATELREEVADYLVRLAAAEERLRVFQEEHRIVAPEEEAEQQVRRYAEILILKDELEVEWTSLASLLALIDARLRDEPGTVPDPAVYRQLATFPTLIANEAVQNLLTVLLDLENERSALLVQRMEDNRDVRQLTERIAEIETQLFRLGTDYLESLDGHLASVQVVLDRISAELEEFPEREMEYLRLFRDRLVLNEAYLMLQAQLRMAEVQDAIRDEGVRIVDVGLVALEDDPEFPKPLVNLFLGMVLGLALGVASALVRDLWEA